MSKIEPIKILYIEDDKLFRDLVKTILRDKTKYAVDVAENGKDGIKLNLMNDYDIIFMDIMMPDVDGVDTAYAIKSYSPNIAIVAVTAIDISDIKHFDDVDFPIDYHIRKPIHSNILISKINEILNL